MAVEAVETFFSGLIEQETEITVQQKKKARTLIRVAFAEKDALIEALRLEIAEQNGRISEGRLNFGAVLSTIARPGAQPGGRLLTNFQHTSLPKKEPGSINKTCTTFSAGGICPYGDKCYFKHSRVVS